MYSKNSVKKMLARPLIYLLACAAQLHAMQHAAHHSTHYKALKESEIRAQFLEQADKITKKISRIAPEDEDNPVATALKQEMLDLATATQQKILQAQEGVIFIRYDKHSHARIATHEKWHETKKEVSYVITHVIKNLNTNTFSCYTITETNGVTTRAEKADAAIENLLKQRIQLDEESEEKVNN